MSSPRSQSPTLNTEKTEENTNGDDEEWEGWAPTGESFIDEDGVIYQDYDMI